MLPVEEAVHRIIQSVKTKGTENVALVDGLNRILADDVVAPMDLPRFTHATVDGFAIGRQGAKGASIPKGSRFRVIENVRAGSVARSLVKPGLAIRVMTGAPLPPGADAVIKEEDTTLRGSRTLIQIERSIAPYENLASAGESVHRGELILQRGTKLRPRNIGILASFGIHEVEVFQQPAVAVFSTGNELVGLEDRLESGKIFASSLYVLLAKLKASGCVPVSLGVIRDDAAHIRKQIRSGLVADAIITVGGTQRGDSDWVRDVFRQMKIHTKIDGVAMSPGKSFTFGLLEEKPIFSLPGSPTACIVVFEELVRPALMKMKGEIGYQNPAGSTIKMILDGKVRGKPKLRKYVLAMVVLRDGRLTAIPINRGHRGSLMPIAKANGAIILPEDSLEMRSGNEVNVRFFDGGP
ncbi:MAG: hypothetical protein GTN74_01515 [Proteobacteria bacterium]|nr:hypothetical protein [Pseudomonadota bacterium]NIS67790.1 hypothetical protein [Pseudomonadota bacterium]